MRMPLMMGGVLMVVIMVLTFVLNKKLDAGNRETAKLERKLETVLKAIDRLDKERLAGLKREKKLVSRFTTLDKRVAEAMKRGRQVRKDLVTAMEEVARETVLTTAKAERRMWTNRLDYLEQRTNDLDTKIRREILAKVDEWMLPVYKITGLCRMGDSAARCLNRLR